MVTIVERGNSHECLLNIEVTDMNILMSNYIQKLLISIHRSYS